MENKPLLIGIAVAVVALLVGGYFLWRSRSAAVASSPEPQVEEFVGRQQADFEEAQRAVAAAAAAAQQSEGEHQHEE